MLYRGKWHGQLPIGFAQASLAVTSPATFPNTRAVQKQCFWRTRVISDSKVPTTLTVDDVLPDTGGSNDNFGGGNNDNSTGLDDDSKKEGLSSMSQKLTLGWNWWSDGIFEGWKPEIVDCRWIFSISTTLYFPQIPSSLGLGLSASLVGVMGSRERYFQLVLSPSHQL
ncbi:hypothetical protein ACS0TY_037014 [Phlomoides rotata]